MAIPIRRLIAACLRIALEHIDRWVGHDLCLGCCCRVVRAGLRVDNGLVRLAGLRLRSLFIVGSSGRFAHKSIEIFLPFR